MLSIINASYQKEYKIVVQFSDKRNGEVDLKDFIFNTRLKPFKRLRDKNIFKNFKVDYTLKWSENLDLAPEYLYFNAFKSDNKLQSKFSEWGYL